MAAYTYNPYPFNSRGGFNNNNNNEADQVALFIDWDNLVISNYADRGGNRPDLEVLVRRAQQYGTIVIARAYAEWNITADRLEVYKAGIEPIYAPVFHADRDLSGQTSRGKSLADPVMVTDCIDFLHLLPQIGTYVLVTGDKDMVPVVRLARLRGRRVVVIGPDYVANVLQQVSDEFIPYRFLLAQAVPTDPYAAYYQQQGIYPPGQLPPGFYPPQAGQAAPPLPNNPGAGSSSDRGRNRRLSSNRRNQGSSYTPQIGQPYQRIAPPPPGVPAPPPPYGYYNPAQGQMPGMAAYPQPPLQPETLQPGAYQPAPAQPGAYSPPAAAPVQPQPQPGPQAYGAPATPPPVYEPYQRGAAPLAPAPAAVSLPAAGVSASPAAAPASEGSQAATAGKGGPADFDEVKDAIRLIIAQRTNGGRGQMRARDLKEELLRKIPNFSERRYGFSKFKALLNAVEQAGILQIDQSGHILWVSAPGTPKMQFGTSEAAEAAPDVDFDDETETESEPETGQASSPAVQAELEAFEGAYAAPEAKQPARVTVEPEATAAIEETRVAAVTDGTPLLPTEERTTSLVEAPIGAHRERYKGRETARGADPMAGTPRPALLDQPYYEDVIVLIDNLRNRNRWLGYELLLSNVRDYLTRHMPESEAKIQAGAILSKLLNDSIIKMAIEVHSRGARKMTVKVAHLQEDNPAVRYALESQKAQAAQAQGGVQQEQAGVVEAEATYAGPVGSEAEATEPVNAEAEMEAVSYDLAALPEAAGAAPLIEPEAPSEALVSHYTRQIRPANGLHDRPEPGLEAAHTPTVEASAEAGILGGEEHQPDQSQAAADDSAGQEVVAPVIASFGVEGDTGSQVEGEAHYVPEGEEAAPAGGFVNTPEMAAGESLDTAHEAEQMEGKQPAAETLAPVAELETEEEEETEPEPEESEPAEGEAPPKPVRRVRRRRTPRPVAEANGSSESMAQAAERRSRMYYGPRPRRHPNRQSN